MPIPETQKVRDTHKHWNILLFADSGAGKTVFALKDKRVLVLAPGAEDDGLMSAARLGTDADQIVVNEWPDMKKANDDLWSDAGLKWLQKNYDVLAVDSLTEMDSMIMREILRVTRNQKLAKDTDPDKPWIDDYGIRNIYLEKMVRSLNDLPINVFYTALPRIAEDPDGKEFVVPMIGGNKPTDYRFAMKIVALMTSYGYMRVEENKVSAPTEDDPNKTKRVKQRTIYWEDTSFSKGKDRTICLAPKTINFTMQHLRLCIEGKIDREGKPIKQTAKTRAVAIPAQPVVSNEMIENAVAGGNEAMRRMGERAKGNNPDAQTEGDDQETEDNDIDLVTVEP